MKSQCLLSILEVVVPGDGGIAWVSWEDLGEATAKIIASGEYKNQTILLSGSKVRLSRLFFVITF